MKLWLDDLRMPPDGWTWAKDYFQAVAHLTAVTKCCDTLEQMSFDHDLACFVPACTAEENDGEALPAREFTGYDVVLWMAEHDCWPDIRPTVHSGNSIGRKRIGMIIDRYGPY